MNKLEQIKDLIILISQKEVTYRLQAEKYLNKNLEKMAEYYLGSADAYTEIINDLENIIGE